MSLNRRASGSSANDGSADSVLTRSNSLNGLTEEGIKSASQRFDLEIVFKLTWTHKGLTRITGLDKCINLVELNLTGNQITKIEGLECALQLRRLILSANKVARVEGVSQLARLEGLWLQDNRLASLESLALPQLAALPALRGLYLQNVDRSAANGVCRAAGYKAAVLAALPQLHNLDGERSPRSTNYSELASEYDVFRANPPAPKAVELPEVSPWLAGVDMEVAMGGGAGEAALQQRHAKVCVWGGRGGGETECPGPKGGTS
ncbi:Protein phosphatase 1 regulatory subunit 7 [Tetrabaena socialis]|uniref:Protein phosphatase 1 regulatory subunit 7 n=1 Tax=Tetrabaena socialis TaxID=47790 RepID=A0A2J8AA53_9CHLO|nr:Protein phosphatase 1 regulatory subunit 7 [Tetrabaena socialis]|eukprot:PNH09404.1 Protein phosphatase 1 regulatory subunit 7 [Tetrabaena socialis]